MYTETQIQKFQDMYSKIYVKSKYWALIDNFH